MFALLLIAAGLGVLAVWRPWQPASAPRSEPPAAPVPHGAPVPVAKPGPAVDDLASPEPAPDAGGEETRDPTPVDHALAAVRASLVPLQVLDGAGRRLRESLGLPLREGAVLMPFSILNGAHEVHEAQATGTASGWWVKAYDPRGFVVLAPAAGSEPRSVRAPAEDAVDVAIGQDLYALSVDPASRRSALPAGRVTSVEPERVILQGGSQFERFVMDERARLVGIGVDATERGAEVLRAAVVADAIAEGQRTTPVALQGLFENDPVARRERGALYVGIRAWSAAIEEFLTALRLDPRQREPCEEGLLLALSMAWQEEATGRSADRLLEQLEETTRLLYGSAEALTLYGLALLERGQAERALGVLLQASQAERQRSDESHARLRLAFLRAGEAARSEGRLEAAQQLLRDGVGRYPDDILLLKSLGYVLYESGDDAGALDLLQRVAALDAGQAAALGTLITRLQERLLRPAAVEIRFDPRAGAIRTSASFNGGRAVTVLVDTGATLTVISQRVADQLRLDGQGARRTVEVVTANGRVRAPLVSLEQVDLQGAIRRSIDAVVLDLDDSGGAQALIGLNFLSAFEVALDSERGVMRLTPLR